jgi:hypothetical protein
MNANPCFSYKNKGNSIKSMFYWISAYLIVGLVLIRSFTSMICYENSLLPMFTCWG